MSIRLPGAAHRSLQWYARASRRCSQSRRVESMPKIVDHEQRRDEIALVACRLLAEYGFDQATIVRIAREAGYTTGMVAHYFDTKQDIILAALRLILRRIEERLTAGADAQRPDLLALLTEALPLDET